MAPKTVNAAEGKMYLLSHSHNFSIHYVTLFRTLFTLPVHHQYNITKYIYGPTPKLTLKLTMQITTIASESDLAFRFRGCMNLMYY